MDGLECSEISYNTIFSENRLDSEFFLKADLLKESQIDALSPVKIGDFAFVTDGIHTSIDYDEDSKINLISAKAPKKNFFDLSGTGYISSNQNNQNPRTQLINNDVIISTVGTIGNCAVVNESVLPANADRHVGIIRISKDSLVRPRYLSTFILSKYGQYQTRRFTTGNVQPNLFIYKVKDIKVPVISANWQETIEKAVLRAECMLNQSNMIFMSAEKQLQNIFLIKDISNQKCTTKNIKDSFSISGRLDAEYYQTKYEQYINALNTTYTISSLCKISDKNYLPEPNVLYDYIELANVGITGNIASVEKQLGAELPSRARRKVRTGQVIVSSVEGSLQSCALITEDLDGSICSTGFYVVESNDINPETLLVLFKSQPIQALMKQRCSGTILTAITKDEFLSMPFPKIATPIQKKIAALVKESFDLRRKSEKLTEYAKLAVEMAIEYNEEIAENWLKEKVSDLEV